LSGAPGSLSARGTGARAVTREGLDCLRATATTVTFVVSQVRLRTTVERMPGVRNVPSWLFEWFSMSSSVLLLCGSLTWSYHTLSNLSSTKPHPSTARPSHAAKAARHARISSDRGAVAIEKRVVLGVGAHVVTVNTASPAVRTTVALSAGGIGSGEPWSQMIDRLRPTAAITGTYFNTATLVPVGSLVAGGSLLHRGTIGTALVIDKRGCPRLVTCRPGNRSQWPDCDTGVRAGPRLLTRGIVTLYPRWEGFRDPAVTARRPRAAVGITRHGKLLLVTVAHPLYLSELARVMRALGARDAMCMDGGTSAALYCRGKSYRVPGRPLTNLLLVYDSPEWFERYAHVVPVAPGLS
jgi:Phosphodiester glycosidase